MPDWHSHAELNPGWLRFYCLWIWHLKDPGHCCQGPQLSEGWEEGWKEGQSVCNGPCFPWNGLPSHHHHIFCGPSLCWWQCFSSPLSSLINTSLPDEAYRYLWERQKSVSSLEQGKRYPFSPKLGFSAPVPDTLIPQQLKADLGGKGATNLQSRTDDMQGKRLSLSAHGLSHILSLVPHPSSTTRSDVNNPLEGIKRSKDRQSSRANLANLATNLVNLATPLTYHNIACNHAGRFWKEEIGLSIWYLRGLLLHG